MSLLPQVLLLDDQVDLENLDNQEGSPYVAVICLFWIAPSTKLSVSRSIGAPCYGLGDIIQSGSGWEEKIYDVTMEIVNGGPRYNHLPWRSYLAEAVYEECQIPQLLKAVLYFVKQLKETWAVPRVVIKGILNSVTSAMLNQILFECSDIIYDSLGVSAKSCPSSNRINLFVGRLREFLLEAWLTRGWRSLAMGVLERLDKTYRWRTYFGHRSRPRMSKHGVTFFSSYVNNSRTLSAFADLMPLPVNWLLTNDSARRGLPKSSNAYSWIWKFTSSKEFRESIPDEKIDFSDAVSLDYLPVLKTWVSHSRTWQNWKGVEFSLLATLTHCWEAYLNQVSPRLVVMANQWGIEGWLAQIARHHAIPVLQVMHGVLGGYLHTQAPILSDAMVVPGEFWRNLWPEDQRSKIVVFNPEGSSLKVCKRPLSDRRRITFFSWPLLLDQFYNFSELTDGFIHILHNLLSRGDCDVKVRFHPLENPSHFMNRWKYIYGSRPRNLLIGKHEPLDQDISQTDVALMYRSTVMLNCLASGIPVIMPGWIDFGWKGNSPAAPNLYLSRDFEDLELRLNEWLENPPTADDEVTEYFVRTPCEGKETFRSVLRDVLLRN